MSSLYQVVESSEEVRVCLTKDADTTVPFFIAMQPYEITPTLPGTFQATGEKH